MTVDRIRTELQVLLDQAIEVWVDGGWAMGAIAVVALVMFALGMHLALTLLSKGYRIHERTWRRWIERPDLRRGPIGHLMDMVSGASTLEDAAERFAQIRTNETSGISRDLRVMRICVSAAPLLGLLGTVTGMLATFAALSGGSGGEKTMGLVASGISEALITTMTGLVMALPGLFMQYFVARQLDRYKAFLAHLESVWMQHLHRTRSGAAGRTQAPAPPIEPNQTTATPGTDALVTTA